MNKENVKNKIASAASATSGAVTGAVVGTLITSADSHAAETEAPGVEALDADEPEVVAVETSEQPLRTALGVNDGEAAVNNHAHVEVTNDNDVEVVDYQHQTTDLDADVSPVVDDAPGDIASIDFDADIALHSDGDIATHGPGDADFTDLTAQNDMPDYVNDADVDTYLN